MAEQTPAAGTGGLDLKALGETIAASVKAAVSEAVTPLHQAFDKFQAAAAPAEQKAVADAKATGKAAVATVDDVRAILADALGGFKKETAAQTAREAYLTSKMADLPAAYRNQLPQTGDPVELAKAEQSIRSQYQADFKAAGGTTAAVAGTQPAGAAPAAAAVDVSKLSSVQKIAMGLAQDRAAGVGNRLQQAPAGTPAAGTPAAGTTAVGATATPGAGA